MKTLRAKLFLSIGVIFLLVGILYILSADQWIKKDLDKAGIFIKGHVESVQNRIKTISSFFLTFHIVQKATDLERVTEMANHSSFSSQKSSSIWEEAGRILSYTPDISFLQIENEKSRLVITPEEALLHSFTWAFDSKGILWVQLEGSSDYFQASPYQKDGITYYLLQEPVKASSNPPRSFEAIYFSPCSLVLDPSVSPLFYGLLSCKNKWLEKMELIQVLLSLKSETTRPFPQGIVFLDSIKKEGRCLLTKDLFSSKIFIESKRNLSEQSVPSLITRNTRSGTKIDMIYSCSPRDSEIITLGASLSSILTEIATISHKNILAIGENFSLAFTPQGTSFAIDPQTLFLENPFLTFENASYSYSKTDLELFTVYLLTPKEETLGTTAFLDTMSIRIRDKVSLTLISAGFFSFIIALILLNNIAKKISQPITLLSRAAEQLGSGEYDLTLPDIAHRQDEVAVLSRSFTNMVSALKDRDTIRGLLNKVVSKEISQQILQHNIVLSGEENVITLFFSDIRNFTAIAETMEPHLLIQVLNAYMTRMCRIIDETHGVVDKFIGDAIMTLYGAPIPMKDHAIQAIKAALWIMGDLSLWNAERKSMSLPVFEIGIGIHTGLVYTGNMGAENRLNYTAIGSNVNEAARICSIANPMQILISEATWNIPEVQNRFICKKLEAVHLKGLQTPVQIYEVQSEKTSG